MPTPITRGAASAQGFGFTGKTAASYLYPFTSPFTFSSANTNGQQPPSLGTLVSFYGTSWASNTTYFDKNFNMQKWMVPATGIWTFEVAGSVGGTVTNGGSPGGAGGAGVTRPGGNGAVLTVSFSCTAGEYLYLGIGQRGTRTNDNQGVGGGGATWIERSGGVLLVMAGGGGGAGSGRDGINATLSSTSNSGTDANGVTNNTQASGGNGGGSDAQMCSFSAAGWTGNGTPSGCGRPGGPVSQAISGGNFFSNGAYGGEGQSSSFGGFGGAAGGADNNGYGGGGGGYSGGGGGGYPGGGPGGGGGSYTAGVTVISSSLSNTNPGYIIATGPV